MSLPSQQIGWNTESKLLHFIGTQLERLTKVASTLFKLPDTPSDPEKKFLNGNGEFTTINDVASPLNIAQGTLIPTTVAGTLEFDGNHLYFTVSDGGTRFQLDQQADVIFRNYVEKTSTYDITDDDYTVNCTANSFTVNLPTAVGRMGRVYNIKNTGTGEIRVVPYGIEEIDGESYQPITQWNSMMIQSTDLGWIII